jgi:hypothetical protein
LFDAVSIKDYDRAALANAAVELPDEAHPAPRVIEEIRIGQRDGIESPGPSLRRAARLL